MRGKIISIDAPLVQGILNTTPDSFYSESRLSSTEGALMQAAAMIQEGAAILDIGGQSTRPNAEIISEKEELERVIPVIEKISESFPNILISIDTFRSQVARQAIKAGAHMINDVSGGTFDDKMFETVGQLEVPYILMHSRGDSSNMMEQTEYNDLLKDMCSYFDVKIQLLRKYGVKDIILDPGFGFAKTMDQNYYLLRHLAAFQIFELPILVGISRKSMIYRLLETNPDKALTGTVVLNTFALQNGASILRVHDVAEAKETITLYQKLKNVSL